MSICPLPSASTQRTAGLAAMLSVLTERMTPVTVTRDWTRTVAIRLGCGRAFT